MGSDVNSNTALVIKARGSTATANLDAVVDKDAVGTSIIAVNVTCPGAELGDFVLVSSNIDTTDLTVTADVTAADTVTVVFFNGTAADIDLGAITSRVLVIDGNFAA